MLLGNLLFDVGNLDAASYQNEALMVETSLEVLSDTNLVAGFSFDSELLLLEILFRAEYQWSCSISDAGSRGAPHLESELHVCGAP